VQHEEVVETGDRGEEAAEAQHTQPLVASHSIPEQQPGKNGDRGPGRPGQNTQIGIGAEIGRLPGDGVRVANEIPVIDPMDKLKIEQQCRQCCVDREHGSEREPGLAGGGRKIELHQGW
jgi:hypothetical protein